MTYSPTTWVAGAAPGISATNLNNIEGGIVNAIVRTGDTLTGNLVFSSNANVMLDSGSNVTFNATAVNGETVNTVYAKATAGSTGHADLTLFNNSGGGIQFTVMSAQVLSVNQTNIAAHQVIDPITTTLNSGAYVTGIDFTNGTNIGVHGGVGLDLLLNAGNFIYNTATGGWIINVSNYNGWKSNSGTPLMELNNAGNLYIAGSLNANTVSFPNGFDLAESMVTDRSYDAGLVLCPGRDGRLARCAHDRCARAVVRSDEAAFQIGGTQDGAQYIALAGRVPIQCAAVVARGDWLTSDGTGGVRRVHAGERAVTLGFALEPSHEGTVLVFLRSMVMEGIA